MSEDDKPFFSSSVKALFGFAIFLILMTMLMDRLITISDDKKFKAQYAEIEIGMTESMVVSMLGAPDEQLTELSLGEGEGLDDAYKRAAESEAVEYLSWHVDFGLIYVVGFNKDGTVVVLEKGGA
ncbi:MAG: hypothetical protein GY727_10050 [Gammaproteobacteria bacterium]|nr:hypothetical protein [Gammaproteobacteria bacterium]MCP4090799.1 hypothetical protein [Gammaproteobacteria bacterium]MCP4277226.1 hypothetical protein [Gammaproteobacteria bacterium]MCP4832848.1 hypothetical protein [Gammaproteobacteria bacterium]MCP4928947.1 hypothetical protein [Gammaproteobacteria bacterium]